MIVTVVQPNGLFAKWCVEERTFTEANIVQESPETNEAALHPERWSECIKAVEISKGKAVADVFMDIGEDDPCL
jgi:hypothetical protein